MLLKMENFEATSAARPADAFAALEERVLRAVEAVTAERERRREVEARYAAAESRIAAAEARAAAAETRCAALEVDLAATAPEREQQQRELDALRSEVALQRAERERVLDRVDRMLRQLDAVEAAALQPGHFDPGGSLDDQPVPTHG